MPTQSKYRSFRRPSSSQSRGRSGGGRSSGGRSGGGYKGQYIDPAKFVQAARSIDVVAYVPTHHFKDFDVDPRINANITAKGIDTPTAIQDETIPLGLAKKDVIGIADTGAGKTIAFALPILHRLMHEPDSHALIIAPTRELAEQIVEECNSIGRGSGLQGLLIIGGAPMMRQLRALQTRQRLVVGTPGRLKDHIERKTLNLAKFNIVVLDEVDRMLDMGFVNDVREILSRLAPQPQRQSFFFSATLDTKIKSLIDTFSHEPTLISIKTGETSENVKQDVVRYNAPSEKIEKLHEILIDKATEKAIVFDATQRAVERLSKELLARGFKADAIHGGKSLSQRQRALRRFKQNEINILVATDVAARGIDVKDISHVINYTQPQSYQDYVHRIGRTGRAGKTGQALTFVN
jgi:superfamily II DNA/RNA helicase